MVNRTALKPGDSVLFQRGGEWRESLVAPSSGTSGNPVTFADFGSGAKPTFWGSVVLDNARFVAISNGIYAYPMANPAYAVLANHTFFNYSFGQPAYNIARSWSYDGTNVLLNSPDSDPRYDGRQYTAVQRDDVVYTNGQSHLVFSNLVVDESARYDDNGGYGFRIMNSQDVVLTGCEAYRAGKHHFGVINSTGFVGRNLVAAYAAPGQASSGGASALVAYGDTSTGLYHQTSEWDNVVVSNMDDPQDNTVYDAFLDHGATLGSILVNNLHSAGAGVYFSNQDSPGATVRSTGGLIQNARLELDGSGVVLDGMELAGPAASIDVTGSNMLLQNLLMHGTNLGSNWYQTAILSRGFNNILRFSTIDMDPYAGSNTAVATTNAGGALQLYGNVLLAPQRSFALWNEGLGSGTVYLAVFNAYTPGSTFAQWVGGAFQWHDISLQQWQGTGFDFGSFQGDPGFMNRAAGDYRPATGSRLIDAAPLVPSTLTTIPLDILGNIRPQGSAYDIGAYETAGTTIQQPAATSTSLSLSGSTLAAQVTAASGMPAGSVTFYDGTTSLGMQALSGGAASLIANLSTTVAHALSATYAGNGYFLTSTSSTVNVAAVPVAPAQPVTPVPSPSYPIALTSPINGQTANGVLYATATIYQTLDAAGSFLLLDGRPTTDHRVTNPPYVYALDTSGISAGPHVLQLYAHDISNSNLLSNPVTIVVTH